MNTIRPREWRRRGNRLRHRELTDHVDVELSTQIVKGDRFHRAADHDACVVDHGVEALRQ
jgi:hypothetical protein